MDNLSRDDMTSLALVALSLGAGPAAEFDQKVYQLIGTEMTQVGRSRLHMALHKLDDVPWKSRTSLDPRFRRLVSGMHDVRGRSPFKDRADVLKWRGCAMLHKESKWQLKYDDGVAFIKCSEEVLGI
jgi:hypothetical protein